MGDMLIRGIPDPLKREIARAARQDGKSLSVKAIELLHKGMIAKENVKPGAGKSAWDALRAVFVAEGAVDDEFSRIMDEIEAERKRDFGRPVEDLE